MKARMRTANQHTCSVIPADAGIQGSSEDWTPAFAGVTTN
jgi:hypothetical protein